MILEVQTLVEMAVAEMAQQMGLLELLIVVAVAVAAGLTI
jgi:hypothetical protein